MKNLPSYFYQIHKLQTNFIVYALLEPNTLEIRYIGKSCSGLSRVRQHFNPSQLNSKNKKSNWLKSLLNKELYPQVKILDYAKDKVIITQALIDDLQTYNAIDAQKELIRIMDEMELNMFIQANNIQMKHTELYKYLEMNDIQKAKQQILKQYKQQEN